MSYILAPDRKCDFKVNKMSFWLCEDPNYLLFSCSKWENPNRVSKIKIVTITENDEIIRYTAFVLHPEQFTKFEYCDDFAENRRILIKWNKCLTKIDKLLLS